MIMRGIVREILSTTRDISERKLAEQTLRESEERFRLITQLTNHLVYDFDFRLNKINWDGAIEEITGFTPLEYEQVTFDKWVEMIHPDDKKLTLDLFMIRLLRLDPTEFSIDIKIEIMCIVGLKKMLM